MQSVALFLLYLILPLLLLIWISSKKKIGIHPLVLTGAFLFKVTLGCIYGYLFQKFYGGDDTWMFHRDGLGQYYTLMHNPQAFLNEFLPYHPFAASHGFMEKFHNYKLDLEYWLMVKPLALMDILSGGNYYINVLFFDFLVFPGPLLFFKFLNGFCPDQKKLVILLTFFLPSVTFWLSGIRSEGWIFFSIMTLVYYSYKWTLNKKGSTMWGAIAGLLGVVLFRIPMLFTLLPALLVFLWSQGKPVQSPKYYIYMYVCSLLLFFGSGAISKTYNFPAYLVAKQKEFSRLSGNTRFGLDSLQPSLAGFAKVFPQAFSNTFLRPFIWEAKGGLQIMSSLEVMAFWIFIFLALAYRKENMVLRNRTPLLLFLFCFGFTQIIAIGYIVPFPGAIVRYKIIPEFFMVAATGILIDWAKIRNIFK